MTWVEKDLNDHKFQPPAMCRVTNQQPRLPRATSSLASNACRDGASTASLGNLFSASPPLGERKNDVSEPAVFILFYTGQLGVKKYPPFCFCAIFNWLRQAMSYFTVATDCFNASSHSWSLSVGINVTVSLRLCLLTGSCNVKWITWAKTKSKYPVNAN